MISEFFAEMGNDTSSLSFQRAALPIPPKVHVHGHYAYETWQVTRSNMEKLRERAFKFEKLLGYDKFRTPEEVKHHIQPRPHRVVQVVFARTTGRNPIDVGAVVQEIVDVNVAGEQKRVLSIDVRSVRKEFEGYNIGTRLTVDTLLENEGIDFITGQSRNGRVFRILEKMKEAGLVKKIGGYEEPLTPEDFPVLKQSLDKTHYKQVAKVGTGLLLCVYPLRDSKDFEAPSNNQDAVRVEERLKALQVPPGGVNGLRYLTFVDQATIQELLPAYRLHETIGSLEARYPFSQALREIFFIRLRKEL